MCYICYLLFVARLIWLQNICPLQKQLLCHDKTNFGLISKPTTFHNTFWCTFLCHHYTTMMWNFLIHILWGTRPQDKNFSFFFWTLIEPFRRWVTKLSLLRVLKLPNIKKIYIRCCGKTTLVCWVGLTGSDFVLPTTACALT